MYEVDSDKFTSKPNPKKEFAHYFKQSGAAAALQKAMVLLYRMPVKPTNLTEFFSQYFENGAQQLMKISLLKAELCYKRDELQSKRLKVQESERHIKERIRKLGISDAEFKRRFVPERIKEKNRLSILERYFKDVEHGIMKRTIEEHHLPKTSSYLVDPKIEISAPRNSNYDLENDCLRNVRSENALKEDIKELDPWGIICKGAKGGDEHKKHSAVKDHELDTNDSHSHFDEGNEQDDDDATSLAELFHQSSRDWVLQEHDENAAKLHNRLLMVKKADKIKLSDFMGWSPLASREDLTRDQRDHDASLQNEFLISNKMPSIESLIRRPCLQKRAEMLESQTSANMEATPHEPDNDAFLLDEDHLEHVYKMMETTQESFDYEFQRYSRKPRKSIEEEICEPICDLADLSRVCSSSGDSVHGSTLYGEDEYEDDSLNESLGFIPGKMMNWTNQYADFPSCSTGEYDEYAGESGEDLQPYNNTGGSVHESCHKTPVEVPLARLDSSCHCIFTGSYDTQEMLNEDNEEKMDQESWKEGEKGRKPTTRGGKRSIQKDEATLTEDSALDNELQEVFKQKQNRKSNTKDKKEEEIEQPTFLVDAFGIDLAKEVKRTILGMSPSEINQNDAQNSGNQFQHTFAPKSTGEPHYINPANRRERGANKH